MIQPSIWSTDRTGEKGTRRSAESRVEEEEKERKGREEEDRTHTSPSPPRLSLVIQTLLRLVEVGEIDAGGTSDEDVEAFGGDLDQSSVGVVSGRVSEFRDVGEEDGWRQEENEGW